MIGKRGFQKGHKCFKGCEKSWFTTSRSIKDKNVNWKNINPNKIKKLILEGNSYGDIQKKLKIGRSVVKNRIHYYFPDLLIKITKNGIDKQRLFFKNNNPNYNIKIKSKMLKIQRSQKARKESRKRMVNYVKNICGGVRPNIGKNENEILDKWEKIIRYPIIRQYEVNGYFLDGYCKELNMVFEVDEKYHQNIEKYKKRDIQRQKEIEKELNCNFIREEDNGTCPNKVLEVNMKNE